MSFFGLDKKKSSSPQRLKPLISRCSDGSILLEWIKKDWRFGISIEKDPAESSWYLVTRKGKLDDSGLLSEEFSNLIKREE